MSKCTLLLPPSANKPIQPAMLYLCKFKYSKTLLTELFFLRYGMLNKSAESMLSRGTSQIVFLVEMDAGRRLGCRYVVIIL